MIKKLLKKIILGERADSDSFIKHLRQHGMRIGERCTISDPKSVSIDVTRPWMIEIGHDVKITHGVILLTHGFDWSVMKGVYGDVLGSCGKVTIGNNVFIGMNSVVLKGVTIGNNVIIGAGSLVNKDIPDNCVAAGNPARVIMSLDEYHEKRMKLQDTEAKEMVREYRKVYGTDPSKDEMSEFFWLFTDHGDNLPAKWDSYMSFNNNRDLSNHVIAQHSKAYHDLEDFLSHC